MAPGEVRAFVGLGSNLDDPRRQLERARIALETEHELSDLALSPIYRSPALTGTGVPRGQPDYLNAVAGFTTSLTPAALLALLQRIEDAQGRERGVRWAARTLDLDLLLYGDRIVAAPGLLVPHPRLTERAFVLQPLWDLAPALRVPGQGALADLLAEVDRTPLERVD